MKKVVVVAYSFPPVGGAGVQRPVKFVKYLRRFDWEPVVLTVENPSVPVRDTALLKDVPDGVKVFSARTLEPSYEAKQAFAIKSTKRSNIKSGVKNLISAFLLPDLQVLWWPWLTIKLIKIIRLEKPACIFVTAPPFSSFIPVVIVGKLFRIPVIVDYRDEWSFSRQTWENLSKSRLAFFLDTVFERMVLKLCQAFTVATQSYLDGIKSRYPAFASKGTAITNGYDADDLRFDSVGREQSFSKSHITIVYTGTVWSATSLRTFCEVLGSLLSERPELRDIIRLLVFGRVVDTEQNYLDAEILNGVVECHGYVDHEQVVREMFQADLLLVTLSDVHGTGKIITGKAFEYMATGKHIFAMVPDGETQRLIRDNYDNATIVHPSHADEALRKLLELIETIDAVRKSKGRDVTQYLRENLTARLAEVFDKVCSAHTGK